MDAPRIVVPKRQFLAGKTVWIIGAIVIIVLVGTFIQMRMTWTRERTRGVTSDATDLFRSVKTEIESVLPSASTLEPITDAFTSQSEPTPNP